MIERGRNGFHTWLATTARKMGWRVAHHKTGGKRLAPDRDTKGFPDFIMIRGDTMLVNEGKGDDGKTSADQVEWLRLFAGVKRIVVTSWAPNDAEEALAVLSRRT